MALPYKGRGGKEGGEGGREEGDRRMDRGKEGGEGGKGGDKPDKRKSSFHKRENSKFECVCPLTASVAMETASIHTLQDTNISHTHTHKQTNTNTRTHLHNGGHSEAAKSLEEVPVGRRVGQGGQGGVQPHNLSL